MCFLLAIQETCHRAIQVVVGYTLSVITPFVTPAPCLVIKTEPHPFYTIVGLIQYTANRASRRAISNRFTPIVCMPFQVKRRER